MSESAYYLDGSILETLEKPSLDLREVSPGDQIELDLFCDEDCLIPLRLILETQRAAAGNERALFRVIDADISPQVREMLERARFRDPDLVGSAISIDSAITWRETSMSLASLDTVTKSRDLILNFERGSEETVDRMVPHVAGFRLIEVGRK